MPQRSLIRKNERHCPLCPCGSKQNYADCCQPLHEEKATAQTTEQLMRSRYSAYVLQQIDYLVKTTHPDKRTAALARDIEEWAAQTDFLRLEILSTRQGQTKDKIGKVTFIVYYRQQGKQRQMRETSRFKRYRKDWVYLDGEIR